MLGEEGRLSFKLLPNFQSYLFYHKNEILSRITEEKKPNINFRYNCMNLGKKEKNRLKVNEKVL